MDVVNFKFVTHDTPESGLIDDYLRVYNLPDISMLSSYPELAADSAFASECMRGLARLGVMRMKEPSGVSVIGIYGNVRIPKGGPIPDCLQRPGSVSADAMRCLYTPAGGESKLDRLGQFLLDALVRHASDGSIHWARFQDIAPRMADRPSGSVLILGDASHACCPALGQGATMAVEDACAASAIVAACAAAGKPVGEMVDAIEFNVNRSLRDVRREDAHGRRPERTTAARRGADRRRREGRDVPAPARVLAQHRAAPESDHRARANADRKTMTTSFCQ